MPRNWVCQSRQRNGRPLLDALEQCLRDDALFVCQTLQFHGEIHCGDTAWLWQAGPGGGLVGRASVHTERGGAADINVDLRIEEVWTTPIVTRMTLLQDEVLNFASIVSFPQGTNFRLTDPQSERLREIIEARTAAPPHDLAALALAVGSDTTTAAIPALTA